MSYAENCVHRNNSRADEWSTFFVQEKWHASKMTALKRDTIPKPRYEATRGYKNTCQIGPLWCRVSNIWKDLFELQRKERLFSRLQLSLTKQRVRNTISASRAPIPRGQNYYENRPRLDGVSILLRQPKTFEIKHWGGLVSRRMPNIRVTTSQVVLRRYSGVVEHIALGTADTRLNGCAATVSFFVVVSRGLKFFCRSC